jgi:hypothetical protein
VCVIAANDDAVCRARLQLTTYWRGGVAEQEWTVPRRLPSSSILICRKENVIPVPALPVTSPSVTQPALFDSRREQLVRGWLCWRKGQSGFLSCGKEGAAG